ncbi:hypothetical protein E2C01_033386 [Portunus trituberculatus]|uniref:Uncharacterized protein n=1 Tax=Portunus trituberculatus TaxID=210409 RepID=A0A5B7F2T4_PORTR|nr:hypothetical protein [Portunus trituberculatus]
MGLASSPFTLQGPPILTMDSGVTEGPGRSVTRPEGRCRIFNIPVEVLQVSRQFRITSQVKEGREGAHAKPPAVGIEALEPQQAAVLNHLLQYWVEDMGVVSCRQLEEERQTTVDHGVDEVVQAVFEDWCSGESHVHQGVTCVAHLRTKQQRQRDGDMVQLTPPSTSTSPVLTPETSSKSTHPPHTSTHLTRPVLT